MNISGILKCLFALICLGLTLTQFTGCTSTSLFGPAPTTLNLAKFPCESAQRHFLPVEFDDDGDILHEEQLRNLKDAVMKSQSRDVYFFIHGWDKTIAIAEKEYQEFICKLVNADNSPIKLSNLLIQQDKDAVIVGLFWPSTIFPDSTDPLGVKFASYYAIRDLADELAVTGLQKLLINLEEAEAAKTNNLHLHFIGHSFGGRILAAGLFKYLTDPDTKPVKLLDKLDRLDLVLLLPATPNDALDSHALRDDLAADHLLEKKDSLKDFKKQRNEITQSVSRAFDPAYDSDGCSNCNLLVGVAGILAGSQLFSDFEEVRKVTSLRELSDIYSPLRICNIYSMNDAANMVLFHAASTFDSDLAECALGACGSVKSLKIIANADGALTAVDKEKIRTNATASSPVKSFDINATKLISGHSDINNKHVAKLIWEVLSD